MLGSDLTLFDGRTTFGNGSYEDGMTRRKKKRRLNSRSHGSSMCSWVAEFRLEWPRGNDAKVMDWVLYWQVNASVVPVQRRVECMSVEYHLMQRQ